MAQHEPPQHHHHDPGEPSSSSSPRQIVSSLPSSPPSPPSPCTNTEQPSPPKIPINANHYAMLLNNDTSLWIQTNQGSGFSDLESKPDNNTILHIAASVGQLDFIDRLIERNHDDLLKLQNSTGDLPVHVAAQACQLDAVKRLVLLAENNDELSTMLGMINKDHNTALHVALLNHQEEMAKFLFEKCPQTFYYLNNQEYSPLYLAIKAQFWELAKEMLSINLSENLLSQTDQKWRQGKSIIHAAIIAKQKDIFEMILEDQVKYWDIEYTIDEMRRTPLSYAAYTGFLEGVTYMFNTNKLRNQAFIIDENGYFPIHWACRGGNIKIVRIFFSDHLPRQTRFLLRNNRQNILHVAAAEGKAEVVKYILQQPELKTLINMKDKDGNTPLHLASMGKHPEVVYALTWDDRVDLNLQNNLGYTALDLAEEYDDDIPSFEERLTWLSLRYAGVRQSSQLHIINFNMNILNTIDPRNTTNPDTCVQDNDTSPAASGLLDQQRDSPKPRHKMKHKIDYKERINTLLLVSTLVTTVTYASGFTVPGGYNNNAPNEGMAALAHKLAFQVFVISNTIALYTSSLAAVTLIWAHLDDVRLVLLSLNFALPLLGTALAMMSVAFMAGLYVVLYNVVSWLGIVVLVMGGLFLGALMVLFIPLYPSSCIRSKILRYVIHVPFTIMLFACEKGKMPTVTF